jgi:hypothetical protein
MGRRLPTTPTKEAGIPLKLREEGREGEKEVGPSHCVQEAGR